MRPSTTTICKARTGSWASSLAAINANASSSTMRITPTSPILRSLSTHSSSSSQSSQPPLKSTRPEVYRRIQETLENPLPPHWAKLDRPKEALEALERAKEANVLGGGVDVAKEVAGEGEQGE
ncbi:hypothetical protein HDU76_010310, partial [Blyttiomyces sp. JEL0837]